MIFEQADPGTEAMIRQGEQEAVRKLEHFARQELIAGDGRAARVLMRLVEAAGLGRPANHVDDGN